MDAEKAFQYVGSFGRYQFFLACLVGFSNFVSASQMVLMVIVGANVTTNSTVNHRNATTIVTDFDLYSKQWVVDLIQSLFMVGFMTGCFTFGQFADMYGRRPVVLIVSALTGVCAFSSGFCKSWQTFAATRCLTGFCLGGMGSTAFVLLCECLGKSTWAIVGLVFSCCFSVGIMFLALLGYLVPRWQEICWITGGICIAMAPVYFIFIPESPRWLYSTGKTEKSEQILCMIARRNGNNPEDIKLEPIKHQGSTTHTLIDFFKYKKLAKWLLASIFFWFVCSMVYYGLTMGAASLTPDLYVGVCLSGAIEIPGTMLCIFLMNWKRMGRKGTMIFLFMIGGSACIALIFVPPRYETVHLVLGLTSKLAIAAIFAIVYIFTSEIFPTPLRSVALGTSSTISRLGSIISPFILLLGNTHSSIPYIIFGSFMIAGVGATILCPETLGRPLPQTVEEVVNPSGSNGNDNDSVNHIEYHSDSEPLII